MKKIFLLSVIIPLLFVSLLGQNASLQKLSGAEYFVDTDPGAGNGTQLSAVDQTFDELVEEITGTLSTSNLSIGAHTIYVRLKNSSGQWGPVYGVSVNVAAPAGNPNAKDIFVLSQPKIVNAEYFIDTDPGQGAGTPLLAGDGTYDEIFEEITGVLNTSNLSLGAHTIYVRMKNSAGEWGEVYGVSVNVAAPAGNPNAKDIFVLSQPKLVNAEYFIDTDPGQGAGTPLLAGDGAYDEIFEEITGVLNTSNLSLGAHTIYIRMKNSAGEWGEVYGVSVNVAAPAGNPNAKDIFVLSQPRIVNAEYFFDTDPGPGSGTPLIAVDGTLDEVFEEITATATTSNLSIGAHTLYVRMKNSLGEWGDVYGVSINIATPAGNPAAKDIFVLTQPKLTAGEYFIDNDPGVGAGRVLTPVDGTFDEIFEEFNATINSQGSPVPEGVHTLWVRMRDSKGGWGAKTGTVFAIDNITPPAQPTGLIATGRNRKAILNWTANQDDDLSYYVIYRSTIPNFTPSSVDSVGIANKNATTYTVGGLTNGTTYYFRIAAVDVAANKSTPSQVTSASPFNTAPSIVLAVQNQQIQEDSSPLVIDSIYQRFTDIDGDTLTMSVLNNNTALLQTSLSGNKLTATLNANKFGTAQITLRASDGSLSRDMVFNIVVLALNDPPILASLPDLSFTENDSVKLYLNRFVSDIDSDTTKISVNSVRVISTIPYNLKKNEDGKISTTEGAPENLLFTIDEINNVITFKNRTDSSGVFNVEISVKDDSTSSNPDTLVATVVPFNPAPMLASPVNFAMGLVNPVKLVWNRAKRGDNYHLQLATDSNFVQMVYNDSLLTDTSKVLEGLNKLSTYFWRVKVSGLKGISPFSGFFRFKTLGTTYAIQLYNPSDNAVNLPINSISFSWSRGTEQETIQKYWFEVKKEINSPSYVIVDSTLTDTVKIAGGFEYSTGYFWRVRAKNQFGWGDYSDWSRFTTIVEKPSDPLLASPVNNSLGLFQPISLKWNKSARAEKYWLQIATDSLFTSVVVSDTSLVDSAKYVNSLTLYTKYFWRVRARNIGGESSWSSVWNFKTLGLPLSATPLQPVNENKNLPVNGVVFKWSKAPEQIAKALAYNETSNESGTKTKSDEKNIKNGSESIGRYRLEIKTDTSSAAFFLSDSLLTDTLRTVNGFSYLTEYFWRVQAKNQNGWGQYSGWSKFTTIIEKPTVPVLALPINGNKGLLNPITTKWNKSLRSERYKLQVSSDSLFTSLVVNDSTLTDTIKVLPTLANYTQYYWRVKAVNVGGESDWSSVWNFKTLGNPYASNLVTPADLSVNQPLTGLTFNWTKAKERIETIQKYQFQVSTDSLFASIFVDDSTLTDTMKVVSGLGYMTKYFWRVRAQNQTGWGDWSDTWRLTTIVEKPTVPVLALPLNNTKGLLNPITTKWTKSLRVEKYKLQVSTDNLFTSLIVNDSTLNDTTKLLPALANYSQYYWRVKAVNVGGESEWSTVWNFKTIGNPYASNLITPANLSMNQPLTGLTFKWTKAKERIETIQKYQLQISTDSLFASVFVNDSTLTDTMKVVGGMGYLTKYFWRVRAQNQTGWGDWSDTWRFTTIVEKPDIPVLALPVNGSKGLLNPITTKWNKSLRVEKYKLQVSADSLFTALVVNDSTLTDTTKVLLTLANYSQFYWRVKAVNVGGESDWSSIWNFKTLGNPYASNLVTPLDASINQPLTGLTFKWTKAKERIETIQKYQLQISTDSLFASVFVNDSTLTDTMKVVSGLGYMTKYFWRVRAQNQTGWGDWSDTWRFTTIVEKPAVPVLALPVNGSKGLMNPITTKWHKSLRSERYKLQVSSDSLFTALLVNDSTLTDTTKVLPTLANYSQYYWRVKAVNVGGESEWSNVWNFKTLGNPYASNLITPLDASINQPLTGLTFKWTKAKERIETIQKYQFQISTDSLFASVFVNDSTLTDTMKVVGGMSYMTKYFWRVRAQNQTGWGDRSETWRFTTIVEKPAVPFLALPVNGSKGLLNPISAKWSKSLRSERYKLQVSSDSLFTSLVVNDSTLTDTTKVLPTLVNYSQYYWRVKAVNVGGESEWSSVWKFKTLGNPYASNLVTPANLSLNQPLSGLTFKWTKAKERIETIQKYQFQVSTDSLFASVVVNDSTLTDTMKIVNGMGYLTKYFWRVRAKNQTGWGDWSDTWRFTTIIEKPVVPVLALPANGSKGLLNPITTKWNKSLRTEKYKLQVSPDSLFTALVVNDSTLTDTTKVLPALANYSQYFWRVKAVNVGGESDWSSVWNFKTLGNPYASNLITPANLSVNQPLTGLTFKWTKAKERIETIQKYQFQVSTDSLFGSFFANDSTLTDTMKVVNGMGYMTKYFWRVRAQNQTGWGEWSDTWRFTTIVEKPDVPVLAIPSNGNKGLPNPVTVKWNKSLRTEKYKLQVSPDSLFTALVVNDSTLTDTTKVLPTLANYSQYYWRVKAVNVGGESDWSTVWNFKTLGNPYASNLITPLDASVNQPVAGLTFKWTKAKERFETIQKYQLQISTDSLFASIYVNDSTLTDTSKIVGGLGYLTKYFWRVRAQNQTGWGDWSNTWRFTTIIEIPTVPLLASPVNNATQQLQPVVLKWKHSQRVEKYTLEVSESSNFTTLFLVDSTLTDTMRTLPQLQTPKTYYWRVKARNIGGTSDYSTVWNFRTLGFPIAVNLIAPANGSVNLPINGVLLKWSTAGEQTLGSVTSGGKGVNKAKSDMEPSIDGEGVKAPRSGNLLTSGSANPTSGIESIGKYWLEIKTDTNSTTSFYSDSTLTDTTKLMSGFGYLTTYYWRVKANNEVGWGSFSGWLKFTTIIERPTQPVLASPANNSLGSIQPVVVKWNSSQRVERYTLEVSTNALFTTVVFKDTTIVDTLKTLPQLSPLTSYYWRVSAKNIGGVSDTSSVWNFKTLGTPTVVTLVTPENNAVNVPISNTLFNWTKAIDRLETIQRYRFELKVDTTSGTFVVLDTLLTDTTKIVASLQNLTDYYWRISAKNEAGWGEFTDWSRFTTIIAVPSQVVLSLPANNAVDISIKPVFKWNSIAGAEKYHLQVASDLNFTNIVLLDSMLTDTTKTLTTDSLNYKTKYYWRVRAQNIGGTGIYSIVWNLTTKKKPIASPTALTASATAVKRVTLSWTDNSDNELGFIILRKTGDSTSTASLLRIDTVGVDVTEFIDSTVTDTSYYSYGVIAYNADTLSVMSNLATIFTLTGIKEFTGEMPKEFALYQNYPNPFNPSTVIRFAIPKDSRVRIQLYTLQGEEIAELLSEDKNAGYYEIRLEIPELASGIYLYRIIATSNDGGEPFISTKKLILMK